MPKGVMRMYTDCTVCPKQIEGVDTELLYAIADARAAGCGLIRFLFCYDDERMQKQALRRARAALKNEKRRGRIILFLFSNDFGGDSTEMEYLRNKYPTLEEDESIKNNAFPFALVHIGERE